MKSLILVLDPAIFAKATEINWKHQEIYDIVLRLGTFNTNGVLMAVIELRFGAAGFRDMSKVITSNLDQTVR